MTRQPLRVLHVGSFAGNVGDNLNHIGFRPWLEELCGRLIVWEQFEIRQVYRGEASFGPTFVEQANTADLVVVGGGNFFELWVEQSPTGCSFSIEADALAQIHTPVMFNALGVDDGQGVTPETIKRFRTFLEAILQSQRYFVSVRNDGAMGALTRYFQDLPLDRVTRIPDGGFFANLKARAAPSSGRTIGFNLAKDMENVRFPGEGRHDYSSFLRELIDLITRVSADYPDVEWRAFAHIYSDVSIYADLLTLLPDKLRRERFRLCAFGSGDAAAREIFGEYQDCDVVLAMRFHANVAGLGAGKPTLGLACYPQITKLYDEVALPSHCVDVQRKGFSDYAEHFIKAAFAGDPEINAALVSVAHQLQTERRDAAERVTAWLRHVSL